MVEEGLGFANPEGQGSRRHRTDVGAIAEDLPHARVGPEGLALDNPDRGELAQSGGIGTPSGGSSWITWLSRVQKESSQGATKFAGTPEALANVVADGLAASESW